MSKVVLLVEGVTPAKANNLNSELETILTSDDIHRFSTKGFTGVESTTYILTMGAGILIPQVAKILIAWIQRNKDVKVKINKVEISGLSLKEIIKLLEEIDDKR